MTESLRQRICLLLILLLGTGMGMAAFAQSTVEGGIGGVVTDQSKAVVPNAKVTAVNLGTNQQTTATSDAAGRFRIAGLQPGAYSVTVSASGFADTKLARVVVEVGLVTSLEVPLNVSGREEVVEVRSEAPVINTTSHDFTTNINETSINELPINGRRWSEFAKLTPGAAMDGNYGLISFRGISGLLNNSTIDGGDNNQAFFSEERGRTRLNYAISQAAIQEFQVNTSNFSSEYGRAAGAVVNAVTKSGTNDIHGSGFYYNRDERLGARNPFSFASALVDGVVTTVPLKPEDRRHQFGGTIGGPIKKDKLFFFFSYDQQKRNFPAVAGPAPTYYNPITVPAAPVTCDSTAADYQQCLNGNTLLARGVTQAQTDAALTYLRSLTGVVPRKGDQLMFLPKLDWRINNNHTASIVYNRSRWKSPAGVQTQATVNRGTTSFGDDFVDLDTLTARLSSALMASVSNELRYQWSQDFEHQNPQAPAADEPLTGPNGMPPAVTVGYRDGGPTNGMPNFLPRAAYPKERRNQIADNLSISYGRHLIKLGADINHVNDLMDNLYNGGGNFSYDYLSDFITDYAAAGAKWCTATIGGVPNSPAPCYYSFTQAFGPSAFKLNTNDLGFYLNDEFRVNRRITLNLGMRYEYQMLPSPQIPNPALWASSHFKADKDNWGPRLGFAADLTGNGKTVLRGGFGLYYGRTINATLYNAITNTGMPTGQQSFVYYKYSTGAPTYPDTLASTPTGAASRPNAVILDPQLQNPRIRQADLVLEREIAPNTVVSASYLMSRGDLLAIPVDTNINPPTTTTTFTVSGGPYDGKSFTEPKYTGTRPTSAFGAIVQVKSAARANYDAMVLQFNRRMRQGLQAQASYTWAHSLDDNQNTVPNPTSNSPVDPMNIRGEYGNSNFDTRHRFIGSLIYAPRFENEVLKKVVNGFSISPIVTIASGRNWTPTVSGTVSGGMTGSGAGGGLLGVGGDSRLPCAVRNSMHYPSFQVIDLRLKREFKIRERYGFEVLAEAFNLFNRVNPTRLNSVTLYTLNSTTNVLTYRGDGTWGIPTEASSTLYRERQVQLAIRFNF